MAKTAIVPNYIVMTIPNENYSAMALLHFGKKRIRRHIFEIEIKINKKNKEYILRRLKE